MTVMTNNGERQISATPEKKMSNTLSIITSFHLDIYQFLYDKNLVTEQNTI